MKNTQNVVGGSESGSEWAESEALVLRGLSGLADEMGQLFSPVSRAGDSPPARENPDPAEGEAPVGEEDSHPDLEGFRSARELRAAQERSAAHSRLQWRRKAGITQALGIKAPASAPGAVPSPFTPRVAAPSGREEVAASIRAGSPPEEAGGAASSARQGREPDGKAPSPSPAGSESEANPPQGEQDLRPMPGRTILPSARQSSVPSSLRRSTPDTGELPFAAAAIPPISSLASAQAGDPVPAREVSDSLRPSGAARDPGSARRQVAAGKGRGPSGLGARIPIETTVRRDRAIPSIFPAVLVSLLLTSLLWAGILYASWDRLGGAWLSERIEDELAPVRAALRDEQRLGEAKLSGDVRDLQNQLLFVRKGHEDFVRMSALEAAVYSENSRPKFDEFLLLGGDLGTGSPAEEFFLQTKKRIESAYSKRLAQHPGLEVRRLLPELGDDREASLSKEALLELVTQPNKASGWDRARAAILLGRFTGDDEVIARLIEVMRDDEDLQVVLATWESLQALTDYAPGAKGFSPRDFNRWRSTR